MEVKICVLCHIGIMWNLDVNADTLAFRTRFLSFICGQFQFLVPNPINVLQP